MPWGVMNHERRRAGAAALMAVAYLLTLATAALYRFRDSVPPRWDQAGHVLHALEYRDLLLGGQPFAFLWRHYAYYPPLVYQITGMLHAALGPAPWVAAAVMEAFALGLLLATYRLGRAFGRPPDACMAAICVLLLPITTVFTREFSLDVPLMAIATAFFAVVFEAPLDSWRRSAWLGVLIGLGLLTKWSFAVLALVPLAYLASCAATSRDGGSGAEPRSGVSPEGAAEAKRFLSRERRIHFGASASRKRTRSGSGRWTPAGIPFRREPPDGRGLRLGRLAASLFVAALLAGPWYATHVPRLWADATRAAIGAASREGDPTIGTAGALTYYLRAATQDWFTVPLALAVLAATVVAVRRDQRLLGLLNLVVWPSYLFFTLIPNKDPRYALPIAPALCVTFAQGILGIGHRTLRRVAAGSAAGLLVLQHVASAADLGPLSAKVALCLPGLSLRLYDPADPPAYFALRNPGAECRGELILYNPFSYFGRRPRREDWQIARIVEAIPDGALVWPPPEDDVHLNATLLQYFARSARRHIVWATTPEEASVVIWKGLRPPPALEPQDPAACQRFAMPDGVQAVLCRTRSRRGQGERPGYDAKS